MRTRPAPLRTCSSRCSGSRGSAGETIPGSPSAVRTSSATARANGGGTALPICRKPCHFATVNQNQSGKPCSRAASLTVMHDPRRSGWTRRAVGAAVGPAAGAQCRRESVGMQGMQAAGGFLRAGPHHGESIQDVGCVLRAHAARQHAGRSVANGRQVAGVNAGTAQRVRVGRPRDLAQCDRGLVTNDLQQVKLGQVADRVEYGSAGGQRRVGSRVAEFSGAGRPPGCRGGGAWEGPGSFSGGASRRRPRISSLRRSCGTPNRLAFSCSTTSIR